MPIYRKKINGRLVWWVRVVHKGLNASRVCASKPEAREVEPVLLVDLKRKAVAAEQNGLAPATVKGLFEAYVADLEARGKGPETVGRAAQTALSVQAVLPELLAKSVGAVRDADIFAFRAGMLREGKRVRETVAGARVERRGPAKPSTINRDLRTLRAMLKKARPEYRFPGGAFFPEDETRVRWLRPEEEILVIDTMRSPFREIVKLAAMTLMRLGELRLLRREMVHLEQGVVLLPKAKAGARPVVLSQDAQKILRHQLEAQDTPWVFPGPDGAPYSRVHVSRVFRKAARAAGLRDFHFHDLRHHGATMALNAGFTAPIVQALGGWKTERMMRRYAAVTDATLRAAAEAVSGAGSGNGGWKWTANLASTHAGHPPSQG
jgi:integrase